MILTVILTLTALSKAGNAAIIDQGNCYGIKLNGVIHEEEVLEDGLDQPYQLAIDYHTNILYFSSNLESEEEFVIGYLNLQTKESGSIAGVEEAFANAVDIKSHKIYFGGSDGIYMKQPDTDSAYNLGVINKSIWQMFAKDDSIYFTVFPPDSVYVYKNNKIIEQTYFKNTNTMLIALDTAGNIYYANFTGLFLYSKDNNKVEQLNNDVVFNGVTSDIHGKIYFSANNGVYALNNKTNQLENIVTNSHMAIYGVAVESNGNFIISSRNSIIRLKPTKDDMCYTEMNI